MFTLGVKPPKALLSLRVRDPHLTQCPWTPQAYLPSGMWIRRTV